ncbi:hypothetical protein AX15_006777 [Amanita polypyramis BW_CC]|nr:hypothetical protein AX15_006777 [Amanita polypyramis BW_CC]
MTISIASTLPPEILGAILLEVLPNRRVRRQIPQEVLMSHVCCHWRRVATEFPFLWTNIDVYSEYSIAWLPSYLERSKPCLLDVRVDTFDLDKRSATGEILTSLSPIFHLITGQFERVQRFFWFTYREVTVEGCRHHFDDLAAPVLQRFHIFANRHRIPWRYSGERRTILNGGAPSLTLVDVKATWVLPRLENVTTLILGLVCPPVGDGFGHELLRIASSAPNLMHLCIDKTIRITTFSGDPPTFLIFNSLRSLKLVCDPTPLINRLLCVFEAPQLESLWLCCQPHRSLLPFLLDTQVQNGEKFPLLRYLTLETHDFSNPTLFSSIFRSATHLHLLYPYNSNMDIFSMFQSTYPEPVQWPNLHTLVIQTIHDAYNTNDEAPTSVINQLRDLVPFRRQINRKIETLLLDSDLFKIASKYDWLSGALTMEPISSDNYSEFWRRLFEDKSTHIVV